VSFTLRNAQRGQVFQPPDFAADLMLAEFQNSYEADIGPHTEVHFLPSISGGADSR
jgi:hypothetical protein